MTDKEELERLARQIAFSARQLSELIRVNAPASLIDDTQQRLQDRLHRLAAMRNNMQAQEKQ